MYRKGIPEQWKRLLMWLILTLATFGFLIYSPMDWHDTRKGMATNSLVLENNIQSANSEKEALAAINEVLTSAPSVEQQKRLNLKEKTCLEMRNQPMRWANRTFLDKYMYDSRTTIAYCHVPKVASTWWFKVLSGTYGIKHTSIEDLERVMNNS